MATGTTKQGNVDLGQLAGSASAPTDSSTLRLAYNTSGKLVQIITGGNEKVIPNLTDAQTWVGKQSFGSTIELNGVTYTLPNADGSNGQYIVTNGSGTLTWATPPTPVTTFVGLSDTPSAYTGAGGKAVYVNSGATALEFIDPPASVESFTDLDDVPSAYTGYAGGSLQVNSSADGLELSVFGIWSNTATVLEGVGTTVLDLTGKPNSATWLVNVMSATLEHHWVGLVKMADDGTRIFAEEISLLGNLVGPNGLSPGVFILDFYSNSGNIPVVVKALRIV